EKLLFRRLLEPELPGERKLERLIEDELAARKALDALGDASLFDDLEAQPELLRPKCGADPRGARADDHQIERGLVAWRLRKALRDPLCSVGALSNRVLDERQARHVASEIEPSRILALEGIRQTRPIADRGAVGDHERSVRASLLAERETAACLG